MKRVIFAGLFVSVVGACGGGDDQGACGGTKLGGNALDGSYCEGLELLFTDVRLKVQESGDRTFLTIDYLLSAENTTTPQKTLTILFEPTAVMIEVNKKIPILEAGGVVRRIDRDMTINLTDDLEATSQVTFSTYTGEIGTSATGEFGFLFKSGRTLTGSFDGTLVDAAATVGE